MVKANVLVGGVAAAALMLATVAAAAALEALSLEPGTGRREGGAATPTSAGPGAPAAGAASERS